MKRCLCDTKLGQVHCVVAGSGSGTPLLLLHQTPRSVDEFAEVMPLLARERQVVAIDTPGYGCSDRGSGRPGVADYAGAVIAVEMAAAYPQSFAQAVLQYIDAAP